MIKVVSLGVRSVDQVLSSLDLEKVEIVFWISRHSLNGSQKEAISYLHQNGKDIIVIHSNIEFKGVRHFINVVKQYSEMGMVYVVAPRQPFDYIDDVYQGNHGPVVFRTFEGYKIKRAGTFVLLGVYEVSAGYNEIIYKPWQARKQQLALAQ